MQRTVAYLFLVLFTVPVVNLARANTRKPPPGTDGINYKQKFLNEQIVKQEGSFLRFSVNVTRGLDSQLNIPMIHTYHNVGAAIPLAIGFSSEFAEMLPGSVQVALADYELERIDIYFAAQLEVREPDTSLKPAYWMFPKRPKRVDGSPKEYHKRVLLGIFDSDFAIDAQVKSNELREFEVQLHDNKVSPDTGRLSMKAAPQKSFAFYSVVISKEQKRAAVTLHWSLTRVEKERLDTLLFSNAGKSVQQLLEAMNNAPWLKGTTLIAKLNNLSGFKRASILPQS